LAVGGWLLAVGGWRLAVGFWLLAVGFWRLAFGDWQLAFLLFTFTFHLPHIITSSPSFTNVLIVQIYELYESSNPSTKYEERILRMAVGG
jgi:hypothetical protein